MQHCLSCTASESKVFWFHSPADSVKATALEAALRIQAASNEFAINEYC
jgi:hypothetical protein